MSGVADLKLNVMELHILEHLVKRLEVDKYHEIRPVLICLDVLGMSSKYTYLCY